MLLVFGGFILGGAVGTIAAGLAGQLNLTADGSATITGMGLFISTVFQTGGALLVLGYLTSSKGTGNWTADFGFTIRVRDWWGIPAGAVLQIGAAIAVAPLIRLLFPEGPPTQSVIDITSHTTGAVGSIVILITLVVLAPLGEELLFRGILLSRLVRSMTVWVAIIVQAVIFGLFHVLGDPTAIAAAPGLMLIAAVIGYAAIRTGDLSLPMFLHAGVNLTAALLLLYGGQLIDWLDRMSGLEPAEGLVRLLTGAG